MAKASYRANVDETPIPIKDISVLGAAAERRQDGIGDPGDPVFTMRSANPPAVAVAENQPTRYGVRRLMPIECERLQGFPDDHTGDQSDSRRYKQLGNAVCVPVSAWIGGRIIDHSQ